MIDDAPEPARARLLELAGLFLRLGITAFGGPAAHIALMENEVVRRRGWISHERFLDMLGAANLIPGPSSSELAVFIGYEQAGIAGLAVAGICFVLPAALITGAIAWAYVRFGSLPRASALLYGVKPVVIAVIVQALVGLTPKALKRSVWLALLGGAAMIGVAVHVEALAVLLGAGVIAAIAQLGKTRSPGPPRAFAFAPLGIASVVTQPTGVGLWALWGVFLKLGAVVFGSGYVLLAFLRADLVERLHWLSEAQLIDAVAVGQVTPGPVFTTATFIGYVLAGGPGAVVATIGIFLPGFVLIAAIRPLVTRARTSPNLSAFLDGVNVASLALMAVVTAQLGLTALVDWISITAACLSAILLFRFKLNSTWLIAGGAAVGLIARGFG